MAVGNVIGYLPTGGRSLAFAAITNLWQFVDWVPAMGFDFLTLFLSYQRGAVGGIVEWQVEVRDPPYLGTYQTSILGPGAVAVGADTLNTQQRETYQHGAIAAATEGWIQEFTLNKGIYSWRLGYREIGVPLTPGSFGIDWQMGTRNQ